MTSYVYPAPVERHHLTGHVPIEGESGGHRAWCACGAHVDAATESMAIVDLLRHVLRPDDPGIPADVAS